MLTMPRIYSYYISCVLILCTENVIKVTNAKMPRSLYTLVGENMRVLMRLLRFFEIIAVVM